MVQLVTYQLNASNRFELLHPAADVQDVDGLYFLEQRLKETTGILMSSLYQNITYKLHHFFN